MDYEIKKDLTKKEIREYWILYSIGFIFLILPWIVIVLPIFFILSPMFFVLGEVPDWCIELRDIVPDPYFTWLNERSRMQAVKNKSRRNSLTPMGE